MTTAKSIRDLITLLEEVEQKPQGTSIEDNKAAVQAAVQQPTTPKEKSTITDFVSKVKSIDDATDDIELDEGWKTAVAAGALGLASLFSGVANAQVPPGQGLATCAGVYATMSVFQSDAGIKQSYLNRSASVLKAAIKLNPNAAQEATSIVTTLVPAIKGGNQEAVQRTLKAEKDCNGYVSAYGL